MKIYLVRGATGDRDWSSEWTVMAFADRGMAQDLCDRLNAFCKEKDCGLESSKTTSRYRAPQGYRTGTIKQPGYCPLDDDFVWWYGGTCYDVEEVPFSP